MPARSTWIALMTDEISIPPADAEANASAVVPADAPPRRNRKVQRVAAEQKALARISEAAAALAVQEKADGAPAGQDKRPASLANLVPVHASERSEASAAKSRIKWWKGIEKPSTRFALYGAALCLALGTGGVLGSYSFDEAPPAMRAADLDSALPWRRDKLLNGVPDNSRLKDEMRSLRAELQTLRASADQGRQADTRTGQEMRSLRAALEAAKTETATLRADLAARVDRVEQSGQHADKFGERLDRLERRLADPTPTASIQKPAAEPPKADKADKAEKSDKSDKPVHGFMLRDVDRGVALIETRRGMIEVAAGDVIPGAGRVESIERKAGHWRVITSGGIIDDQPE
jgi:hypothetical protein